MNGGENQIRAVEPGLLGVKFDQCLQRFLCLGEITARDELIGQHGQALDAARMVINPSLESVGVIIIFDGGQVILFPIQVRSEAPRHLDRIIPKLHIDLAERRRVPFDRRVDEYSRSKIVQNSPDRIESVFFDEILHQQRRLVVGELKVFGFFGTQE